MEIYLKNLAPNQQDTLLQRRLLHEDGLAGGARPAITMGPLSRWWTNGIHLSPRAAHTATAALRGSGSAGLSIFFAGFFEVSASVGAGLLAAHGHALGGLILETAGTGIAACYFMLPKIQVRNAVSKPVTRVELEALQAEASEEWTQNYLRLVREAAERQIAPQAADAVRDALSVLGVAIEQLPKGLAVSASPENLRAEAAQTAEAAQGETDPVVAASWQRRAEALTRAADLATRSQTLMRRTAALRDEATMQIEALRLSLTSLRTDTGDSPEMLPLAEAVHAIAAETAALAAARAELDAVLPVTPRSSVQQEESPVMIRSS